MPLPQAAATRRLLTRASRPRPPLEDAEVGRLRDRAQALLPRYELCEALGRGGAAVVFRAVEEHLGRDVALKVLVNPPGSPPDARARFAREARAMARLRHPNIVVVHDFGSVEELDWIAMELVEGATLRDVLSEAPLDAEEFVGIALPLLAALEYAHGQGIIHRDVKPENVLIDVHGHVKVADFGLAKWADPIATWNTASGVAMGTPRYVAPEQVETPGEIDPRADVFSLGVVLYEMLTGEAPLGIFEQPSVRSGSNPALDDVVMAAMARDRSRRPASVAELRDRVLEALDEAVSAPRAAAGAQAVDYRLRFWNQSQGADFVAFIVIASCVSMPDSIRGAPLITDPVWIVFVVLWLIQSLVVSASVNEGKYAGGAVARTLFGVIGLTLQFFWIASGSERRLDDSGEVLFSLLVVITFLSLFSGLDWLYQLHRHVQQHGSMPPAPPEGEESEDEQEEES